MRRLIVSISMILAVAACGEDKNGRTGGGENGQQAQAEGGGAEGAVGDEDGGEGVGAEGVGAEGAEGQPGSEGKAEGGEGVQEGGAEAGEGDEGGEGGEGGGEGPELPPAYDLEFSGVLPDDIKGLAIVRVTLFDEFGARSEAREVDIVAVPEVARGEECDTVGALNACGGGDLCYAAPIEDIEGDEGGADEGGEGGEGFEGFEGDVGGEGGEGAEGPGDEGAAEGGDEGAAEGFAEGAAEGFAEGAGGDEGAFEGDEGDEGDEGGEGPREDREEACADNVIDFFATATQDADKWSVRGNNDQGALLQGSCGGEAGEEVVYRFVAPAGGLWAVSTQHDRTAFDTLLYARTACDDDGKEAELSCNDDTNGLQSRIQIAVDAEQEVFVIVDAFGAGGVGRFVLTAYRLQVVAPDEACDPDGALRVCRPGDPEADDLGDLCVVTPPDPEDDDAVATGVCATITVVASGEACDPDGSVRRCRQADPEADPEDNDLGDLCVVTPPDPEDPDSVFTGVCETIRVVAPGEVCDPDGSVRLCRKGDPEADDLGDFCFITPADPDDPDSVATGECEEITPPNIANALAYRDGEFLSLQLFGEDTSRDVVGVRMELLDGDQVIVLDEDDGTTLVDADFFNNVYGETEFVGRVRFAGLDTFPQTDGVRVQLLDSQGLTSNTIDRPLDPIPRIDEGEVCDLQGVLNGCEGTGVCVPPEEEEGDEDAGEGDEGGEGVDLEPEEPPTEGTCFVPYVPVIVGVDAFYDPDTNALGLAFQVADEDEDVVGFSLDLLDAEGFPIPLGPEREPGEFFDLRFPEEPPVAGECIEPVRECPEDFDVLEIPLDEENDRWFVTGDTTGAAIGAEGGGTCGGGGGGRHVYAFAPFEDGLYIFTTDSGMPGADTVLYIREFCGYSSPGAQLGCNDDISTDEGLYMSQISVELLANKTVWVFVDGFAGFGGGWEGDYELIVTRKL